jgi:hypothetical protein
LRQRNAIVAAVLASGGTAEDACVLLANQVNALIDEVTRLQLIAPRKVRLPDGRVVVWRCPDELVPE